MVNYLKSNKKWIGIITLLLLIIKLGFEYKLELLRQNPPKPLKVQVNYVKCTKIYNDCIVKTQAEPQGDFYSLSCERIKDLCEKGCQ